MGWNAEKEGRRKGEGRGKDMEALSEAQGMM